MNSRSNTLSRFLTVLLASGASCPALLDAQASSAGARGYSAEECPPCAEWNAPAAPVKLHGNTWYVGTRGLAAILITSDSGHVLIDAGLPESAEPIMASIRALGFRVGDIELIVTSHAHYDHAGGVAEIQRASGALVAASASSAKVLRSGELGPDDPQFGIALAFPAVDGAHVREIADRDTLRVGSISLVMHSTPGHTPGGSSWSWRVCETGACLDFVYADSQTPVSADGFLFTRNSTYPSVLRDFEKGQARLEALSCDVLLTPHPGASKFWERVEARDAGRAAALRDPEACRRYVATARTQLARRVAREAAAQ